MTLATTPTYHRNLEALTIAQPLVAERIDSAPIPADVQPATGRDGTSTLLVPGDSGKSIWFGQSSMPSVSAAETCANFVSNGRNALLPGVLTGLDPIVVAGKMPPHTALFVVDHTPLHVKLAMYLYDYAELIAAGRIVFLLVDDIEEHLCALLETHPGYDVPTQLLHSPQHSPAQIGDLQRRLEAAGLALSRVYNRVVETCAENIRSRTFGPLPEMPRVAVVSVDAHPASHEQAHRVGRALGKLSWPHEVCLPDDPRKCHIAARIQAIDRISAELVLLINSSAGPLRSILPPRLRVVSWYLPGASVTSTAGAEVAEHQAVFVSSASTAEALVRGGVSADSIKRCDPCADDTIYRPADTADNAGTSAEIDVAVLADLPDDRAEACGIALPSHRTLWQAIQKSVSENIGRYRDNLAAQLVDEAQDRSGVELRDAALRSQFVSLVHGRIAPACIARSAVKTLAACSDRFAVWGCNWSVDSGWQAMHRGQIPIGEALNRVFHQARLVVLPDSSELAVQTALDALAAGVRVICRAPDEPFERGHPGLAPLAPHLHFYRTKRELGDTVRRIKSQDPASACEEREAARAIVLAEHTVSQRLLTIIDHVRKRQ